MIPPNIRMIYYLALFGEIHVTNGVEYWVHNDIEAINHLGEYAVNNGIGKTHKEYMQALVAELLQKG